MNALKALTILGATVASICLWDAYGPGNWDAVEEWASENSGGQQVVGFEAVPLPDGMSSRGIVVFAPKHCTSEAAARTEALVRHLSAQRVAFVRTDRANFSSLSSPEEASRVTAVMNGPVPVVYVNGKAKANPSPEEVMAEYRRGKG